MDISTTAMNILSTAYTFSSTTVYIITAILTLIIAILIAVCIWKTNRSNDSRRVSLPPEREEFYFCGNEIRITLLGKSGNGKSATGNTIIGGEPFVTKMCAQSITARCSRERRKRFGVNILVVNTPGLCDTGIPHEMVFKEIIKCVHITSPGPHAFLLVLSVNSRFIPEEEATENNFIKWFGEHIYHYLIIIFTRKDELERQKSSTEQYFADIPPNLKDILHKCGDRCMFLNNIDNEENKATQCFDLLTMINDNIKKQSHPFYTDQAYQAAERHLKEMEEEKKKIKKELEKQLMEDTERINAGYAGEKEVSIKELYEKNDKTMLERLADLRENTKKQIENETTGEKEHFQSLTGNLKKMGHGAVDATCDVLQLPPYHRIKLIQHSRPDYSLFRR